MLTFESLGLSKSTLEVLNKKGFEIPSAIQAETIPAILTTEKDIVAQAQTGTGKTAAFGLPVMEKLKSIPQVTQVLVLVPTRELAIQVAEELHSLKGNKELTIVPIYGGQSYDVQLRRLKKSADIVVGTPGRVMDHIKRKTLKLEKLEYLILDEADEMLNMGFLEDVREILKFTPDARRTLMFSATMPNEIKKIAEQHMKDYDLFKTTQNQLTASKVDQIYFEVSRNDKFEALCRIIDHEEAFYGVVFCRTKVDVDQVATHLMERGYDAEALHGDVTQTAREKILQRFKKETINILVATDVAARGIDVQNLTHVINYALPQDPESYVHRIGRTGRAGREGIAITFITSSEYRKLQFIQQKIKKDIRKGKLPSVKELIKVKRKRIAGQLEEVLQGELADEYLKMADDFLEKIDPREMVAGILQYTFQDELSEKGYAQIDSKVTVDREGKTRLFVSHGKKDGLTKKKLIETITKKCGIPSQKIRNVEVLDKFSFVTLPFHQAEAVLNYFKRGKKGQRTDLTITKAKKERK